MNLHDIIVEELTKKKSLAALIYLIDSGRELEFEVNEKAYFISCDNAEKYVSLWENELEQSFDSVCELIENATIDNHKFLFVWDNAEIKTLF